MDIRQVPVQLRPATDLYRPRPTIRTARFTSQLHLPRFIALFLIIIIVPLTGNVIEQVYKVIW